ncbi:MAG: adenylyl-sulfate kinase [candidate division Zixibacteria bacterium]|nr:adenylyl-sulfate kinase [candidate division Zixibacteria bacterium]
MATAVAILEQPWTIWITGLSGAGKTTISKRLVKILQNHTLKYQYLRQDDIRQFLTPNPTFSKLEKELMYRTSIFLSQVLNKQGINAIIDSVDGRGEGRQLGKEALDNFKVVWIDCPIDVCIKREKHRTDKAEIVDLYQRALQGELKLPGMGYDYALEKEPLLKIDTTKCDADEAARMIAAKLIDSKE